MGYLINPYNFGISRHNSMYEAFSLKSAVLKNHLVEWCTGVVTPSRWTREDTNGTGTDGMVNTVNEGMFVASGATSNNDSALGMNDIAQFDHGNSKWIGVVKSVSGGTSVEYTAGMAKTMGAYGSNDVAFYFMDSSYNANVQFWTADGAAQELNSTSGTVAVNANWNVVEIELNASSATMTINGNQNVTNSTELPSANVQPVAGRCLTKTSASREARCRYLEVYNK